MIRKIVSIKNTGKFRACTPKFLLNKFTVIYSENGRGKTTLSNIFRSLHEQDGSFIIGRKTLGGSGEQVVELLSEENKLVSFKGNQWQSRPNFDIEIFDSTFISQNVYSRHIIEHDQKRQLYLFTIGKHGGQLADRLVAVDEQIRQQKSDKKNLEKVLLSGVEGLLSVTDFVGLTQISNIDEEIHKQSQLLKALEKQSEINSKPLCAKISLPLFDKDKFRANLAGITLENLLDNAEDLTKQHIQQHLDPQGEKWLEYGVSKIIEEEKCPFCGQEIKGVAVVTAFKTYFSDQYKKAIHTINHLESAFATKFAVDALLTLQKTVQTNLELIAYWNTYDAIELECQLDWEWIRVTWDEFTKGMGSLIAEKKLMPLGVLPTKRGKHTLSQFPDEKKPISLL
ncbi:AAA family ATPase [Paenibacillus xylanilyticus]|uniref:AAA family ATPase n=1 Tax=Paenibacillus xylanilyticus TaxID=248903 RepID=A0A7Y6EWV7_9BACL|nr:AAA family ATPase [Paenibacillus xylanilyticus]NUU79717.1 AAA family ATPase [Paenibacillus xylanilyticus]